MFPAVALHAEDVLVVEDVLMEEVTPVHKNVIVGVKAVGDVATAQCADVCQNVQDVEFNMHNLTLCFAEDVEECISSFSL
jgi:hypothetical protein